MHPMTADQRVDTMRTRAKTISSSELCPADMMETLPASVYRKSYLLIMIDRVHRWLEAAAITKQMGVAVTTKIISNLVVWYAASAIILRDPGPCFNSEVFKLRFWYRGTKHMRSFPHHSQANGLTERNNAILKEWLTVKWSERAEAVEVAFRQATMWEWPLLLIYARRPRLAVYRVLVIEFDLRW